MMPSSALTILLAAVVLLATSPDLQAEAITTQVSKSFGRRALAQVADSGERLGIAPIGTSYVNQIVGAHTSWHQS